MLKKKKKTRPVIWMGNCNLSSGLHVNLWGAEQYFILQLADLIKVSIHTVQKHSRGYSSKQSSVVVW